MIAVGFFSELTKLAGEISIPSMRHIQLMKDPISSGLVKPSVTLRINGGARNVGYVRPPTPSSNKAAEIAARLRSAVSRKTPALPTTVV